ncbi:hypothetical protein A5722_14605 [Mycobacterium vulneris]|nr:hypothetical protein A5722_14605 [Mycolicibacterium vulneris]OCB66162.1 hypothetical protein A5729_12110 [Mycolicibacterium vulneris]
MKLVKLIKPVGVRQPGEVLELDSASAAALVKRGDAKEFDPASDKATAERTAPPRGNVTAVAVVDADIPSAPAADEKPAGAEESAPVEPNAESLTELRARAVQAGKVTEDEAKALTKKQLLDKLGEN